jgi:signal transduction histidine kinase
MQQNVPKVDRIHPDKPAKAPRARLAGFLLAVVIGGLALAWINTSVRQSMKYLERDFGAVKTERFYQAVHVRQAVLALNEHLREFRLAGGRNLTPLTDFHNESRQLQEWIAAKLEEPAGEEERALQQQLAEAFKGYLADSRALQERQGFLTSTFTSNSTMMKETNETLDQISRPVLQLCERLMSTQSGAFGAFLKSSQRTLDSLQQWIQLSLVVLLVLAVSLAVLVYRGMIAPLQVQLSESQAIIARQEKLAALGSLAAGVAHEIRNPLTAIKFRLFSLKKSLPSELATNEDAAIIGNEISRLERIVRDFLEFARPSDPELSNVSARQLLEEVSRLMQPQLEEAGIQLETLDSDGLWLQVDFQQIKQVLINLIRNAAESIAGSGTITLRAYTGVAPTTGSKTAISVIEVADTGRGMTPEVSRRLFDPFFTTKEGGTGLGLSIAVRIVENHGGELQFESQLNHGTTFKLLLPTVIKDESPHSPD